MSTLIFSTMQDRVGGLSVPAATVQQGAAKAWANVTQSGTQVALDSFGVASVTDTGVGSTQINFTTVMANTGYLMAMGAASYHAYMTTRLVGSCEFQVRDSANAALDNVAGPAIFGDVA